MRISIVFLLFVSGFRFQVSDCKAQIMPEFWFSPTSDTLMMIEARGETPHKSNLFVYIMGTRLNDTTNRVRWFRAYMDSTSDKKAGGYSALKADTIRKYKLTLKADLISKNPDTADTEFKIHQTRLTRKTLDTTVRIFQIMFRIQINVGKEEVITTRDHYYEYIGKSTEEAYEKSVYTLIGWTIPGKNKQFWMLGTMDSYIDPNREFQVLTVPVNYYGFR